MKKYEKPTLKVVVLQHENMLLTGSKEVQSLNKGSYFIYEGSDENVDEDAR